MSRDSRNNDENSFLAALFSAIRESFRETKHDSAQPRDSSLVRWGKFLSVIVVLALLVGTVFALEVYFVQFHGDSWFHRSEAQRMVREDDWDFFRWRFLLGTLVGGGIGGIYVVRCLIRKVDP